MGMVIMKLVGRDREIGKKCQRTEGEGLQSSDQASDAGSGEMW